LVLQSSLRKVSPEKLTVGQWTAANARILAKLIKSGRLVGAEVADYLEYNRKIGDLLQIYTASSVFHLDHIHRQEIHEGTDRRWHLIDCTLENAHLKRRDEASHNTSANAMYKPAGSQGAVGRRNVSSNGKRGICWAYNSTEGCPFSRDRCRYDHIEQSERNYRGNGIPERAPRFQTAADKAVSKT
jgi:hypothetical protein